MAGDTSQAQTALMSTKSSNQSSESRVAEVPNQESGFPDTRDVGINFYVWKTMKITTTHNLSSTSNISSNQNPGSRVCRSHTAVMEFYSHTCRLILLFVEDIYIINRAVGPPPGVLAQ